MQRNSLSPVIQTSIRHSLSGAFSPVFLLSALAGLLCIGAGPAARAQSASVTYLHTFLSSYFQNTDGDGPFGNLIQGADGSFYGTTAYGGTYGAGTVYKITPDGTDTFSAPFLFTSRIHRQSAYSPWARTAASTGPPTRAAVATWASFSRSRPAAT